MLKGSAVAQVRPNELTKTEIWQPRTFEEYVGVASAKFLQFRNRRRRVTRGMRGKSMLEELEQSGTPGTCIQKK